MKLLLLRILLATLGLVAMSCGKHKRTSKTDFSGIYVASFSHGSETLLLRTNGTYEQKYVSSGGTISNTNTGSWVFHQSPNAFIHLQNALLFDTRFNQPQIPPTRTDLALNVKIWLKGVELVINDELGLGYRKQPLSATDSGQK